MNHSNNTSQQQPNKHITHEPKGLIEKLQNLQPTAVFLLLLAIGVLAYMLWVFFGGYAPV